MEYNIYIFIYVLFTYNIVIFKRHFYSPQAHYALSKTSFELQGLECRQSKIVCLRTPGEAAAEAHDGSTLSSHQAEVEKFVPFHSANGRRQIKWHRSKSFFQFCEAKHSTDAEGADALRDFKLVEKDNAVFFDTSKASKIKVHYFFSAGQTEQDFQEAEKGNVTERGPAEDCPREFVHGIVLQTETAIEGWQRMAKMMNSDELRSDQTLKDCGGSALRRSFMRLA